MFNRNLVDVQNGLQLAQALTSLSAEDRFSAALEFLDAHDSKKVFPTFLHLNALLEVLDPAGRMFILSDYIPAQHLRSLLGGYELGRLFNILGPNNIGFTIDILGNNFIGTLLSDNTQAASFFSIISEEKLGQLFSINEFANLIKTALQLSEILSRMLESARLPLAKALGSVRLESLCVNQFSMAYLLSEFSPEENDYLLNVMGLKERAFELVRETLPSERVVAASKHNGHALSAALELFPRVVRSAIAKRMLDELLQVEVLGEYKTLKEVLWNAHHLSAVISVLPNEERYEFVTHFPHDQIKGIIGNGIGVVLSCLPSQDRLRLVEEYYSAKELQSQMSDGFAIANILAELDPAHHLPFLNRLGVGVLRKATMNSEHLAAILNHVSLAEMPLVIAMTSGSLAQIAPLAPQIIPFAKLSADKFDYILRKLGGSRLLTSLVNSQDFGDVERNFLSHLTPEQRQKSLELLIEENAIASFVRNGRQLAEFLKNFPIQQREQVVRSLDLAWVKSLSVNDTEFTAILFTIAPDRRLNVVEAMGGISFLNSILPQRELQRAYINLLLEQGYRYLMQTQGPNSLKIHIHDAVSLGRVLGRLSPDSRGIAINSWGGMSYLQTLIDNKQQLSDLLPVLPAHYQKAMLAEFNPPISPKLAVESEAVTKLTLEVPKKDLKVTVRSPLLGHSLLKSKTPESQTSGATNQTPLSIPLAEEKFDSQSPKDDKEKLSPPYKRV